MSPSREFALVWLHRRRTYAGELALAFLVAYPAARFVVEFWRGDDRGDLFGLAGPTGLSPAQLISVAVFAVALPALVIARRVPLHSLVTISRS